MRGTVLGAIAALTLAAGCRHAQRVEGQGGEEKKAQAPAAKAGGTGGAGKPTPSEKKKDERAPTEPGRPPLATSPEGLMVPGGVAKLQGALEKRGLLSNHRSSELDEETSSALRRFQEQQGLARTGAPDRETLRKLGLDPAELFRTTDKVSPPKVSPPSD